MTFRMMSLTSRVPHYLHIYTYLSVIYVTHGTDLLNAKLSTEKHKGADWDSNSLRCVVACT